MAVVLGQIEVCLLLEHQEVAFVDVDELDVDFLGRHVSIECVVDEHVELTLHAEQRVGQRARHEHKPTLEVDVEPVVQLVDQPLLQEVALLGDICHIVVTQFIQFLDDVQRERLFVLALVEDRRGHLLVVLQLVDLVLVFQLQILK
eukprot:CAMPEP_0116908146 /NCGR_PEP_ID=MMETSP0467-20121206/13524_1 /TAXON_ID=283647 /ORGANISM="Mesodinium pulex, Strain SPMC105" /LENGTH=145 /DNA_ID=CAMNT_0004583293 /DNA_START=1231 /DNA_END=1668 /DNA_ORIENTATION=+